MVVLLVSVTGGSLFAHVFRKEALVWWSKRGPFFLSRGRHRWKKEKDKEEGQAHVQYLSMDELLTRSKNSLATTRFNCAVKEELMVMGYADASFWHGRPFRGRRHCYPNPNLSTRDWQRTGTEMTTKSPKSGPISRGDWWLSPSRWKIFQGYSSRNRNNQDRRI